MAEFNFEIFDSNCHTDERGKLVFYNSLNLREVKRQYSINALDITIIRAWQGHQKESKWFQVIRGAFKIVLVKIDDWNNPSGKLATNEILLSEEEDKVLFIPGGYANGLQAVKRDSKLLVFSDSTLEDSLSDNFRFDKNLWYRW